MNLNKPFWVLETGRYPGASKFNYYEHPSMSSKSGRVVGTFDTFDEAKAYAASEQKQLTKDQRLHYKIRYIVAVGNHARLKNIKEDPISELRRLIREEIKNTL